MFKNVAKASQDRFLSSLYCIIYVPSHQTSSIKFRAILCQMSEEFEIEIKQSDGLRTTWPGESSGTEGDAAEDDYNPRKQFEQLIESAWKKKLAELILLENGQAKTVATLQAFPDNYKLFVRWNRKDGQTSIQGGLGPVQGAPRYLLFGHPSGAAFESPTEFFPHLRWLTTDRTMKRKRCRCTHCPALVRLAQAQEEEANKNSKPQCYYLNTKQIQDICDVARKYGHFRIGELVWAVMTINAKGAKSGYVAKPGVRTQPALGLKRKAAVVAPPSEWSVWWPAFIVRRNRRVSEALRDGTQDDE